MRRPKKKEIDHLQPDLVSNVDAANYGYNQACSDWEKWLSKKKGVLSGNFSKRRDGTAQDD